MCADVLSDLENDLFCSDVIRPQEIFVMKWSIDEFMIFGNDTNDDMQLSNLTIFSSESILLK